MGFSVCCLAGCGCQHPIVICDGNGVGRCETCGAKVLVPGPIIFSNGAVR